MAVNIFDLPPQYQAQALKKHTEQERRRGQPAPAPACIPGHGAAKVPKFRNKKATRITENGAILHFDSQKEARRYDYLILRERAGEIRDLRLQVDFPLQEAYTDTDGNRVRAIRYKADFTYMRPPQKELLGSHAAYWAEQSGLPWELVVEDVKSKPTRTREYIMKKKMLKDRLGINISEV